LRLRRRAACRSLLGCRTRFRRFQLGGFRGGCRAGGGSLLPLGRVGFIGGVDSVECRHAGPAATKRLVGEHFRHLPGGHLFPLESPQAAASATNEMICALLNN
ncbi:MAG: hypothetical protein NWQ13_02685, partial [Glaciimonas sp.]|nr:hypothetical protein [Glaciimonas sp.]